MKENNSLYVSDVEREAWDDACREENEEVWKDLTTREDLIQCYLGTACEPSVNIEVVPASPLELAANSEGIPHSVREPLVNSQFFSEYVQEPPTSSQGFSDCLRTAT